MEKEKERENEKKKVALEVVYAQRAGGGGASGHSTVATEQFRGDVSWVYHTLTVTHYISLQTHFTFEKLKA